MEPGLVAGAQDKQSGDLDSIYCCPSGFPEQMWGNHSAALSCFPPRHHFTLLVE